LAQPPINAASIRARAFMGWLIVSGVLESGGS
jgi:hypothetical protein